MFCGLHPCRGERDDSHNYQGAKLRFFLQIATSTSVKLPKSAFNLCKFGVTCLSDNLTYQRGGYLLFKIGWRRDDTSLDKYLQEIGREELITVEQEVELAQRIREGDQVALEKLTRANLRFVVSVAKQYQNQGLSLPDLINEVQPAHQAFQRVLRATGAVRFPVRTSKVPLRFY
mgnify:CR=1 FL=1